MGGGGRRRGGNDGESSEFGVDEPGDVTQALSSRVSLKGRRKERGRAARLEDRGTTTLRCTQGTSALPTCAVREFTRTTTSGRGRMNGIGVKQLQGDTLFGLSPP